MSGGQRGVVERSDANGEIEPIVDEVGASVAQHDLHPNLRVLAHEGRDNGGEKPSSKEKRGGDAKKAGQLDLTRANFLIRFFDRSGDATATLEVDGTELSGSNAARRALEKTDSEKGFEASDAVTDRLFGGAQLVRGSRETVLAHDRHEQHHVSELPTDCHEKFDSLSPQARIVEIGLMQHGLAMTRTLEKTVTVVGGTGRFGAVGHSRASATWGEGARHRSKSRHGRGARAREARSRGFRCRRGGGIGERTRRRDARRVLGGLDASRGARRHH